MTTVGVETGTHLGTAPPGQMLLHIMSYAAVFHLRYNCIAFVS